MVAAGATAPDADSSFEPVKKPYTHGSRAGAKSALLHERAHQIIELQLADDKFVCQLVPLQLQMP